MKNNNINSNKLFGNINNSLYIILNQYKKDNISEDEAVQLIEDLYKGKNNYVPTFPTWPSITYSPPHYYEVTCSQ